MEVMIRFRNGSESYSQIGRLYMKRRTVVIGGIVVLALVLVGAVFVGSQLLSGHGLSALSPSGLISAISGGGSSVQFHRDLQPAAALPLAPADVPGLFDHRPND